MAAVTQEGRALGCASKSLRADRDVVMAAVRQNGDALEYASVSLQADREVVMAAMTQSGLALVYASYALRADPYMRRLARRFTRRQTQPRLHAFLEYARLQRESQLQARVDLFMIKNDLHDWIDAKRSRAMRQRRV
jgi:hypothetical protein